MLRKGPEARERRSGGQEMEEEQPKAIKEGTEHGRSGARRFPGKFKEQKLYLANARLQYL